MERQNQITRDSGRDRRGGGERAGSGGVGGERKKNRTNPCPSLCKHMCDWLREALDRPLWLVWRKTEDDECVPQGGGIWLVGSLVVPSPRGAGPPGHRE